MNHITNANNAASGLGLVLTRNFDAPRELVWSTWTEVPHLERWICPRDFTVTFCQGDLRPGGRWCTGMRAPDGTGHICGGEYREIVPPARLVFTHAWEDEDGAYGPQTLVTVTLEAKGRQIAMRFEQTGFSSFESRDGHEDGWRGAFENLADHLERITTHGN
jgi:uncharacterized protein YndB with AHSA1/START domain